MSLGWECVQFTSFEETFMPSGHASHKSTSAKPNVNADGLINAAADSTVDPQDIVSDGGDSTRTDEALQNPAATQRKE